MNQITIGKFIAKKRKEQNLTQEQLAEKIGVSNKSVSKWECGKCMPDYSSIELLCKELNITVAELLDGEENEKENIRLYDDEQMLEMIERVQQLEKQKQTMYGILLMVMGMALLALSQVFGGSNIQDFISGILMGLSIGEMLAGVYVVGKFLR